jgi:hypothetical protein
MEAVVKWLTALETDGESITLCRLMNVFRRKGISIAALTMNAAPRGSTVLALIDATAPQIEHLRSFLRGTAGISQVACYRHEAGDAVAFSGEGVESASLRDGLPPAPATLAEESRYLPELWEAMEANPACE